MGTKNRSKAIVFSVVALTLVTAGFWLFRNYTSRETIRPKRGDVVESIYGLGTVTASKVYHVRTGLSLSIKKLFVNEGDLVKSGDALVQLDENIMRSPISGTVTTVSYKDGELVAPQSPIVSIANLESIFLEVSLEQQSILRVKKGQSVSVSFESLRSEKYEGDVSSVYPRNNQFIVRIDLHKWPAGVLPGMTADVAILVGKKTNALLIPIRSLVGGQATRIRGGKKERVPVKLGVIDGEWGEVISENILETDELINRK